MSRSLQYISLAETSGYGLSAESNMLALRGHGVDVHWLPLFAAHNGYRDVADPDELSYRISKLRARYPQHPFFDQPGKTRQQCRESDCRYVVQHTVPELWPEFIKPGSCNVGYTVWETTQIPRHWVELCGAMDRVLVPSTFSRDVFEQSLGGVSIKVVPHIARDIVPAADSFNGFRVRYGIPRNNYVFYTVNTWNIRKAPWLTLHAYLLAFEQSDPVSLVIKTDTMGERYYDSQRREPTRELVRQIVENYPDPPHVCLIDHEISCADMNALHCASDCYFSLSHAEGWALGAFEAGSVGKPVIITDWGGPLDYLSQESAYLVDCEMTAVRNALAPASYAPEQQWATANLDDAIDKLRWVYSHQEEGVRKGSAIKRFIDEHFRAENIGPVLVDAVFS